MSDKTKLLLLDEPVRRTIETLRALSNKCECLDDDSLCGLSNMALWLEGVLSGNESYCHKGAIAKARQWKRNRKSK